MSSKPNGILTKADREFLTAEGGYYTGEHARQSRYQRRRDIRQRIVQSILDFSFIASHLGEDERRKIFENPGKHTAGDEFDFDAGVGSLLAWLYFGYREQGRKLLDEMEPYLENAERDYHLSTTGKDGKAELDQEMYWTSKQEQAEELARKLEKGEPILAESILAIPTLRNFDVNIDNIESLSVFHTNPEVDFSGIKTIIETILEEQLDLKVPVEVHVVDRVILRPSDFKDEGVAEDDVPSLNSRNTRWNELPTEDIIDKAVDESVEVDREDDGSEGRNST